MVIANDGLYLQGNRHHEWLLIQSVASIKLSIERIIQPLQKDLCHGRRWSLVVVHARVAIDDVGLIFVSTKKDEVIRQLQRLSPSTMTHDRVLPLRHSSLLYPAVSLSLFRSFRV